MAANSRTYEIAFALNGRVNSSLNKSFNSASKMVGTLTKAAASLGVTLAGGAMITDAVSTYVEFEQAIANVAATTGEAGENLKKLETLARDMGKKTTKTATEAAEALNYMGLAGWDLTQMMEGIEPVLRLSEAGGIDLARTSDLVTDSMAALGLEVSELQGFLDQVAKTAAASNTDVDTLMESFLVVGGSFREMNTPLDEANALLGILANRGKKGSEAGNSLSSILVNLTSGAGQAGDAMEALGVHAFDNKGNFKGITNTLLELNEAVSKLNEEDRVVALSEIGGKSQLDTLQALLAGVKAEYGDLRTKIADSDGELLRMAETMNDTTKGAWALFLSAMDEVKIKYVSKLGPTFKFILRYASEKIPQSIDKMCDALSLVKDWAIETFNTIRNQVVANQPLLQKMAQFVEDVKIAFQHLRDTFYELSGGASALVWLTDTVLPNLVDAVMVVLEKSIDFYNFIKNNWSLIEPIVTSIGVAFGGWKVATLITDFAKLTIAIFSTTFAQYGLIKAKLIDKAQTLYLKALYAGEMVKALLMNAKSIGANTIAWTVNTAQLVAQKVGLLALKGIQLASQGVTVALTAAQWALNAAFIASPIGWVVIGIGALVAIGVALWKNWDTIKVKAFELWEGMKSAFGGLGEWFGGLWEGVKSTFKSFVNFIIGGLNKIPEALNTLNFTVPDWVPRIGGKSMGFNLPKIPQFYTGTTGYNTPNTFIAGERGPELVTNATGYKVFNSNKTKGIFGRSQSAGSDANDASFLFNPVINIYDGGGDVDTKVQKALQEAYRLWQRELKEMLKETKGKGRLAFND